VEDDDWSGGWDEWDGMGGLLMNYNSTNLAPGWNEGTNETRAIDYAPDARDQARMFETVR
jgi:hypothetical protein